jgi:hypothetical protein
MELKIQQLKELYEKDFLLWLEENLKLLENREYDLVDWENLLEEIRDMEAVLKIPYRDRPSSL